jgi:two-component system sensor kinase FixL
VLGELTSALAHELNQPLAAILSNAQAARRFMDAGNADPVEMREILEDIIRDDKRAGEVIHRLRAMLQKGEMSRERLSVEQVIAEAIALLNGELMVQGVDVQVHAAAQLLAVEAGRVELQQVLVNLLLNAARAMQELPSSERVIKIRIDAGDGDIVVAVEDRGQGIAADDLPRIFEPFFTTVSAGMGMGLAICRRIMQLHGGRIWAENNASGGATFFFSLPVSEQRIIDA